MEALAAAKRLVFRPKRYTNIVIILLVLVGIADAVFVAYSTNSHNRELLQGRALAVADALPHDDINLLTGSQSDIDSPIYNRLKDSLQQIKQNNTDIQTVYIMTKQADTIRSLVDSEPVYSENYMAPGTPYIEASEGLKGAFDKAPAPFFEGPVRDRWGAWVSALAPVIDPDTKNLIAFVGMDTTATEYYSRVLIYALVPLCLASIPLAGLLRDRRMQRKEYEINQLKEQFVSIASHELRSPLNGMLWAIQSLIKPGASKNLTKQQEEMLVDMYRSTESSIATINEILDLSVFENRQAHKMQRDKMELRSILQEVMETLRLGAYEKEIKIVFDGSWPEAIYAIGDAASIKRAYMNIIANAIKYSPEKSDIKIAYSLREGMHVIAIKDNGIGIPEKEQKKVLEGYYRAKNATKLQAHGTGLGLWLARLITEEHGGRLGLTSQENKGTTIFVSLPAIPIELPTVTTGKSA